MSESDVTLKASGVSKRFTTPHDVVEVLRDVDLELAAGDAVAITGPSGSGKSTLLHLVGTLDRPSAGTITIGGRDPFALSEPELARFRNRTVGFVFQEHHLLPHYSVLENVLLPTLAFPGDDGADGGAGDAEGRARALLDKVGLGHRLRHRPAELSGGERQRVAVARALINRPALLLCDEPTGSLDQNSARTVGELLTGLDERARMILMVVTHSLELAAMLPRRYELREGRLETP